MRKLNWLVGLLLGVGLAGRLAAAEADLNAIAAATAPALVRVEIDVQFADGEKPRSGAWATRCPNCGHYHSDDLEEFVNEERPLEAAGLVLSPTEVLTRDVQLHPRFIRAIRVRQGAQVVPAHISFYAAGQNAVRLQLEQPLAQAKPLAFGARKAPFFTVNWTRTDGQWVQSVAPLGGALLQREDGRTARAVPAPALIVDAKGAAVGASFNNEISADDSWQGSPLQWPGLTADEMAQRLKKLEEATAQGLLSVTLRFRSQQQKASGSRSRYRSSSDERESETEKTALGLLIAPQRVLVLAELKREQTARLEQLAVTPPQGAPVTAKFVCSLKDYGAFVIALDRALPGPLACSTQPVTHWQFQQVLGADVTLKGDNRRAFFVPLRIGGFEVKERQQLAPEIPQCHAFLFDQQHALIALPLAARKKVTMEDRSYRDDREAPLLAAVTVAAAVAQPEKFADAGNVPQAEADARRLAWMGVELQKLTRELARANHVAPQTRDGEVGALVTHVYPDSPAALAGIKAGAILLQLHVPGQAHPVEVQLEDENTSEFPWERIEEVPEQYFETMPTPWSTVENSLTRILTDLGMNQAYTAEFLVGGQPLRKDFTVARAPLHFDAAARYKSAQLGLTVRDVTYEVRRYYQRKPDEPGVIVSKIEPGSKASVAGLKPYELITHVNDQPVTSAEDFRKLTRVQPVLRFATKNMVRNRLLEIKLTAEHENDTQKSAPAVQPNARPTAPAGAP